MPLFHYLAVPLTDRHTESKSDEWLSCTFWMHLYTSISVPFWAIVATARITKIQNYFVVAKCTPRHNNYTYAHGHQTTHLESFNFNGCPDPFYSFAIYWPSHLALMRDHIAIVRHVAANFPIAPFARFFAAVWCTAPWLWQRLDTRLYDRLSDKRCPGSSVSASTKIVGSRFLRFIKIKIVCTFQPVVVTCLLAHSPSHCDGGSTEPKIYRVYSFIYLGVRVIIVMYTALILCTLCPSWRSSAMKWWADDQRAQENVNVSHAYTLHIHIFCFWSTFIVMAIIIIENM